MDDMALRNMKDLTSILGLSPRARRITVQVLQNLHVVTRFQLCGARPWIINCKVEGLDARFCRCFASNVRNASLDSRDYDAMGHAHVVHFSGGAYEQIRWILV